jgi:hypothetical protein
LRAVKSEESLEGGFDGEFVGDVVAAVGFERGVVFFDRLMGGFEVGAVVIVDC